MKLTQIYEKYVLSYNTILISIYSLLNWDMFNTRSEKMTTAEIKELISFGGIGLLILAILFIQLGRRKLTGVFSVLVSILAYICLIIGGLIVVFIVISGPTG